ncbi:hypothetical protein TKK_0012274 [Trichogramma kaykai]
MSRNKFCEIKSKIKFSKPDDKNDADGAWKVLDEMMVRFFGRSRLKQFVPSKPDRYGIKLWGLAAPNGYLFNLDVYCGRNDTSLGINLSACALGSRVVLQMLNPLLCSVSKRKLSNYHVYFDNFFTSPDLVVHLKNIGLLSTGTVRKDREEWIRTISGVKKQHQILAQRNGHLKFFYELLNRL